MNFIDMQTRKFDTVSEIIHFLELNVNQEQIIREKMKMEKEKAKNKQKKLT